MFDVKHVVTEVGVAEVVSGVQRQAARVVVVDEVLTWVAHSVQRQTRG